jgi:hypothetical protein
MNRTLLFLLGFLSFFGAQAEEITRIDGFAPKYIGRQVEIFQVMDYVTLRKERIAYTTVGADSMFHCSFFLDQTRKLVISSDNNYGEIYASPGAEYLVYLPLKGPHDPYRPLGNQVEIAFSDLDTNDVNYKILEFDRWMDEYVFAYYTKHNAENLYFAKRVDQFKSLVEERYKKDTSDLFLMTHIKYSVARMDDLNFTGSRNKYEKYDHFLRRVPVQYQSDTYMEYMRNFYDDLLPRVSNSLNEKIYQGILKSSPSVVMTALGSEYILQDNRRLRELVMLRMLGEAYYNKEYPGTNILTILDSLQRFALYPEHKAIASNLVWRLTELTQGSKAADFRLPAGTNTFLTLDNYKGKYLYVTFLSGSSTDIVKNLELLEPIYQRYRNEAEFLTLIQTEKPVNDKAAKSIIGKTPWKVLEIPPGNGIYSTYQVMSLPHYLLIDPTQYIVANPALGPVPNGKYETIDMIFYQIKKSMEGNKGDGR